MLAKIIAAEGCALVGKWEAAGELMDGVEKSLVHYFEVNFIAGLARTAIATANSDEEEVRRLENLQYQAASDIAQNTPILGQGIGIYHYAQGDIKAGNDCMVGPTR